MVQSWEQPGVVAGTHPTFSDGAQRYARTKSKKTWDLALACRRERRWTRPRRDIAWDQYLRWDNALILISNFLIRTLVRPLKPLWLTMRVKEQEPEKERSNLTNTHRKPLFIFGGFSSSTGSFKSRLYFKLTREMQSVRQCKLPFSSNCESLHNFTLFSFVCAVMSAPPSLLPVRGRWQRGLCTR